MSSTATPVWAARVEARARALGIGVPVGRETKRMMDWMCLEILSLPMAWVWLFWLRNNGVIESSLITGCGTRVCGDATLVVYDLKARTGHRRELGWGCMVTALVYLYPFRFSLGDTTTKFKMLSGWRLHWFRSICSMSDGCRKPTIASNQAVFNTKKERAKKENFEQQTVTYGGCGGSLASRRHSLCTWSSIFHLWNEVGDGRSFFCGALYNSLQRRSTEAMYVGCRVSANWWVIYQVMKGSVMK